jgi:predicted HTH transcriptional regulator
LIRGVSIEAVLIDITEKRVKDGKGSWRRRGISIKDRALTSWHESIHFKKPADYLRFIPFKKNEEFTTSSLSRRAGIDIEMARKALYVLTKMKVVKRTGKKGNSWIYLRN